LYNLKAPRFLVERPSQNYSQTSDIDHTSFTLNRVTTLSIMTFNIMELIMMTFNIMKLSMMTFSITTLSIMTLTIKGLYRALHK